MRTRDGRVIPVAQAVAPLLDEKENIVGAVGAFWDLSREQAAELTREHFLTMVAHQLRSPLTALLSALQLLERQNLSEERRAEMWAIVKSDGERLRKFADEFLDLEAVVKSPHALRFEPLSIATVARKLVKQYRAGKSKHHFRVRVSKPEPTAYADPDRVEHILRNLLDNAVTYSPAGSRITVSARRLENNMVEVAVQDQGLGIPFEDQEKIFKPFYRPKSSRRRVYGHGLGLSLAREMVKEMGGTIRMDSEENRGSTFYFTLPGAR
jgi:signal transduction histidine kinase